LETLYRLPIGWMWWSAFFSGFTILFLFWSITLFGEKTVHNERGQETKGQDNLFNRSRISRIHWSITFSDSFWFSASRGRSLRHVLPSVTAMWFGVFEMDVIKDPPRRKQMDDFHCLFCRGLSIGVHLFKFVNATGLLALIIIFKKNTKSRTSKGAVFASFLGGIALIIINNIIHSRPS